MDNGVKCRSRTNPYSITACTYSQDGNILIYAKGYNWIFVEVSCDDDQ